MEVTAAHRKLKRPVARGKQVITRISSGQVRSVRALLNNNQRQLSGRCATQSDGQHKRDADRMNGRIRQQMNAFGVSQTSEVLVQRQEQSGSLEGEGRERRESGAPVLPSVAPAPGGGSARTSRCYANPEFPDFRCLASALKLDIDENLWANAHQFYRVATLFPGDNELMWNTFLRYGLGVNLLQTSFGFLGANETLGTILSYGTGVGLKSYDFLNNGVLELDIPISIGQGFKLDLQLDLNADPNDLAHVRQVGAGIGFSGHF
ncbi:MAG: hypothetical protein MRK00_14630 [Nitrosomonas sp.]|nr:hypothetical protein [Nitrosomonas sp.]